MNGRHGRPRQVYMNKETEKKALELCDQLKVSMSALIRLALEKYIADATKEEQ